MTALLILRLALAAMFCVAGLAKLLDRAGARAAIQGFGVPERLAGPAVVGLPVLEVAVAAGLVPAATAGWAAAVAAALLLAFAAAIARSLRRGEAPDCHCFGRLHSASAGPGTLARNAVLAAAAGTVAVAGFTSGAEPVTGWTAPSAPVLIAIAACAALAAVLAGFAWFGIELLRLNGRLLERLDALEAGRPADEVTVAALDGSPTTLADVRVPGTTLALLFTDPGCGPCNDLLPEIAAWQAGREDLTLAVVSRGDAAAVRAHAAEHGLRTVLLDPEGATADHFGVAGTPSAVLLDAEGRPSGAPAAGATAIRALLGEPPAPVLDIVRVEPEPEDVVLAVGDPAPAFDLPGRLGPVRSADLLGAPTLLVFWNPDCGYCARMADDLRILEADAASPRIVLVSTAADEKSHTLGLRSTVAFDAGFAVSRSFGANGTPSAILVDEHWRVASALAAGDTNVLGLVPVTA